MLGQYWLADQKTYVQAVCEYRLGWDKETSIPSRSGASGMLFLNCGMIRIAANMEIRCRNAMLTLLSIQAMTRWPIVACANIQLKANRIIAYPRASEGLDIRNSISLQEMEEPSESKVSVSKSVPKIPKFDVVLVVNRR